MKQLIQKLVNNPIVRYVFFGGLTTLVNFVTFYILTELLHGGVNISNIISVALSILFALFKAHYLPVSNKPSSAAVLTLGHSLASRFPSCDTSINLL